jgi:hypothetical protein
MAVPGRKATHAFELLHRGIGWEIAEITSRSEVERLRRYRAPVGCGLNAGPPRSPVISLPDEKAS